MRQRSLLSYEKIGVKRRLLTSSAQERGTAYEKHCMAFLQHHLPRSITQLKRTGKAGDEGIDLTGRLEPSGRLLIVQCKATKPVVGPAAIRELEGTLGHQRDQQPLGMLFGASGFAPATCERCATSDLALALLHLPAPPEDAASPTRTRLNSILLSRAAQETFSELVTIRRAINADGEAFVRLDEVT